MSELLPGIAHLLVLGGARSGKSRFAEREAATRGLSKTYVATATAFDAEMRDRIAAHQADRAGAGWRTVEEPLDLVEALGRESVPGRVLLVDCLTLWLGNILHEGGDVEAEGARLVRLLPELGGPVIFVSNEVGSGIVPDNASARAFRDAQGRLNQAMGAACGRVVLVVAGLPLWLKP